MRHLRVKRTNVAHRPPRKPGTEIYTSKGNKATKNSIQKKILL
ncbi:hypothetical protein ACFFJJ_03560 [Fictibacillus phosphorivorans]